MNQFLTDQDSKRVADALIAAIEGADIESAVRSALRDLFHPSTRAMWKEDWFPLSVEHMCDQIERGVIAAFERKAEAD